MLSKKSKYALKAMMVLAKEYGQGPVLISDLAQREDIPRSVGHIVRVLDGPIAPLPCVSKMAYMRCRECRDERTCAIRFVMKEVRDATAKIMDSTSLADMLRQVETVVNGKEPLSFAI